MEKKEALKNINSVLEKTKDTKEIMLVLQDLLTQAELCYIWERIEVVKLLKNGLTQREIAQKLWISVTTVSRWNKLLSFDKKIIDKLI